jgi:adenylosuccinate synthase
MVPGGFVHEKCRLLVAPGANVEVRQLLSEIEETHVKNRIGVDSQASIIEEKHALQDKSSAHLKGLGTTGRGIGPAIEERVRRTAKLAKDIPELKPYLTDVATEVNDAIDGKKNVLLEGTQGLQLSLFHGTYPYVTGRDTSASAICSEAGVGPTRVDDVLIEDGLRLQLEQVVTDVQPPSTSSWQEKPCQSMGQPREQLRNWTLFTPGVEEPRPSINSLLKRNNS